MCQGGGQRGQAAWQGRSWQRECSLCLFLCDVRVWCGVRIFWRRKISPSFQMEWFWAPNRTCWSWKGSLVAAAPGLWPWLATAVCGNGQGHWKRTTPMSYLWPEVVTIMYPSWEELLLLWKDVESGIKWEEIIILWQVSPTSFALSIVKKKKLRVMVPSTSVHLRLWAQNLSYLECKVLTLLWSGITVVWDEHTPLLWQHDPAQE